ncbi:hypothetical protein D9M68_344580 [compost metagenome]
MTSGTWKMDARRSSTRSRTICSSGVAATLVPNAVLKVYPGGSHGLIATNADAVNADLLDFLKA